MFNLLRSQQITSNTVIKSSGYFVTSFNAHKVYFVLKLILDAPVIGLSSLFYLVHVSYASPNVRSLVTSLFDYFVTICITLYQNKIIVRQIFVVSHKLYTVLFNLCLLLVFYFYARFFLFIKSFILVHTQ